MYDQSSPSEGLPNGVGVGYKPQHFSDLLSDPGPVEWIEVHAENYMGDGGRPHAQLSALSERFALSVHGVGLSIGGDQPLDLEHLARLRKLIDRTSPARFSEHLAWSTHGAEYLNDLLPLPYTPATLARVASHITQVQETLGRQMLLENPSSYLSFAESTLPEAEFLGALVHKTGCGLLLDVNNVFISATNLGLSPHAYIDAYPLDAVGEIHVGGHEQDYDGHGAPLLIDSHGAPVVDAVWSLLDYTLERSGPRPVLVEWDSDVPEWPVLRDEAARAATLLSSLQTD
ncbi:MNIO family bufferin maturase [Sulfitobacter guttiformis]|uniref:UPF0276 protein C8N30_3620 n=1 Tax=Sulfitobacter guttiformis TaxID=74349 RepID=A0A420DJU1_9RHOB|nr:DUF692 domain-containing protein [Sulfitobacter guttiformis]KIN71679.1 DUF692 domain containing protein [Sulfitobacter guttiformis KCTC 32187]RKE94492.1 hypothetical protein C8N30_3620 [Sulfitobacter guttiformis]